ncbi:MAG: hypothetical protein ACKVP3_22425 [Hyphomicrobiaceae bacterium]
MLKAIAQLALVAVPLTVLTMPLGAAVLPGVTSSEPSIVHRVQKRGKKPPASSCTQPVTETGKGRITESQAKTVAEKAWQEKVRSVYGEAYVEVKHARGASHRCSSTPTLRLKRCDFTATPCRPPAQT